MAIVQSAVGIQHVHAHLHLVALFLYPLLHHSSLMKGLSRKCLTVFTAFTLFKHSNIFPNIFCHNTMQGFH